MRILFLTPRPLRDPRSGGTIKSAAVLDHLERRHEVDVVCFAAPEERWERSSGRTLTVPLDRERSIGRLLSSYAHGVPLSIERNRSRRMRAVVGDLVAASRHEVAFVDGWLMAQYLPSGFRGRSLLHQHNAEHVMWRRQAELERSPLRRPLVRLEAWRVRRYEAGVLARFDVVLAVSEPDRAALLGIGAPPPVPILPNVPDPSLLDRPALEPSSDPVVLTLGTLSWQPNVEGLVRFLRTGFPALRRQLSGVRFVVAGSGAPPALAALVAETEGAELHADVEDAEVLYRRARCFVDLGVGGAGTRVKLLNALARGIPVVATRDAAEGLDAVPDTHLLVADDAAAAVPQIARLLTDDRTWRSIRDRGRELIRARYVPAVAFTSLDETLSGDRISPPRTTS